MMRHGAGRQKNESQPIASVPGPDRRRAARAGGDLALRQFYGLIVGGAPVSAGSRMRRPP